MLSSGMLGRVALVGTDVSEERIASTIAVTRIGEIRTTLAVTSSRSTLRAIGVHLNLFADDTCLYATDRKEGY
jgi:hypothetical protein